MAISLAMWLSAQIAGGVALVMAGYSTSDFADPDAVLVAWLVLINWVGLMSWPLIAIRMKGTGSLRHELGLSFEPFDVVRGIVGSLVFYGVNIVAGILYFVFSGSDSAPTNTDLVDTGTQSTAGLLLLFFMVAVGTPVIEELWFRGFLLRALDRRFGVVPAVAVSSIVFGLFHVQGEGWGDLFIVGLLTVFGAVLAIMTVRFKWRLGPAIVCHAINNGVALLLVML